MVRRQLAIRSRGPPAHSIPVLTLGPRLHPDCEEPVKGYLSGALADVHLQSSQAARATSTTKGHPPDWWLFALLNVHRDSRGEAIRHATQVVWLMAKGGIKVRKH